MNYTEQGNKSFPICSFCGDRMTVKTNYCIRCKTQKQRKEQIILQLEINKENKEKGYIISDKIFGFNIQELVKKYKIKL